VDLTSGAGVSAGWVTGSGVPPVGPSPSSVSRRGRAEAAQGAGEGGAWASSGRGASGAEPSRSCLGSRRRVGGRPRCCRWVAAAAVATPAGRRGGGVQRAAGVAGAWGGELRGQGDAAAVAGRRRRGPVRPNCSRGAAAMAARGGAPGQIGGGARARRSAEEAGLRWGCSGSSLKGCGRGHP
jgi:hypothetical protein